MLRIVIFVVVLRFICVLNKVDDLQDVDLKKKIDLLADKRYCGYQHADDRLNTSKSIDIDEFPWVVLFRTPGNEIPACSGTLINRQYVVTSAGCFTYFTNISIVHLGVYNRNTSTFCVIFPAYQDCTDPIVERGIEKIILHPDFNETRLSPDVAVVRLNKSVQYSDYIRPICLPLSWTKKPKLGDLLVTTGWGPLNRTETPVSTKKRVWHRLVFNKRCPFYDGVICSFVETNGTNQFCGNDWGGPLMFTYRNQWFLQGILTAGIEGPCLQVTASSRVTKFLPWILSNLEEDT